MGADQPVPGQVTGPLAVQIEAGFTSVNVGSPVVFSDACHWAGAVQRVGVQRRPGGHQPTVDPAHVDDARQIHRPAHGVQ